MRSKGSLRRLVGRNLRFNRADPPLHCGQPSPLRCALLSPQGLTTLRGPHKSPRAGARRANHLPSLALVAPMSHCFACSLALLLSLPKELSLLPPPAALQFLAPQRRGTVGEVSKYFAVSSFFLRQISFPHPLTATREAPRLPCVKGGGECSEPEGLSAPIFCCQPSRQPFGCHPPLHREGFLYPKFPIISQTRKLFMKLCVNSTLSLQISPFLSVLVRGLLIVNDK